MQEIVVELNSEHLKETGLISLTASMVRELNRIDGLSAKPMRISGSSQDKGTLSSIGQLVTNISSNKAVESLVNFIKIFLGQNKNLKVTIKRPDGLSVELDSSNLSSSQLENVKEFVLAVTSSA